MEANDLNWLLVSGDGMILAGFVKILYWRRLTRIRFRWFWIGAALWAVAVIGKIVAATATNGLVFGLMRRFLPENAFLTAGGIYGGLQSSFFEIGLTFATVLAWKSRGSDADRAIGVGPGVGAFEAMLFGLLVIIGVLTLLGVVHGRIGMVASGFVIFAYIDAVATAAHLSGRLGSMSVWWIELAILPAAIISIPILRWCYSQWGRANQAALLPMANASPA